MTTQKRNYSLLGAEAEKAVQKGLVAAQWYHTEVARKDMKDLMQRSNQPALRDTIIWIGSMIVLGTIAALVYPSWWSLPVFLAYGVLYASASDSRWHECSHGTAFKTQWMNQAVYQLASFLIMRNPTAWRWSHSRHHTDTIIVGADPEIILMRPPVLFRLILNVVGLVDVWAAIKDMARNALGNIDPQQATFIPESERPKVVFVARIWVAIYATVILIAILSQSWLPLLLVGLPRLYGCWHMVMCGVMQHVGLAEDVLDHRLNSRTVYMNPISRFIYWNMNYHVEHHMFPMVPYHALPRLHALIKHDLPAPNTSILQAYAQITPAVLHQLRNERWFIKRELPATAKPYRAEFHGDIMPGVAAE
jgi:fatty acid desaturase